MGLSLPRLRHRRRDNPDGSMSLMEHVRELRNRLFLVVVAVAIGATLGFIWWGIKPFGIISLGELLTDPYCGLPESARLTPTPGRCQLLQTTPFEAFTIRLQVGLAAGAVLTSPLWFYQIWAFITPGLYQKERRFALTFVCIASLLFTAGAVLAYYVVPAGLSFLVELGQGQFITALTGKAYIGFVLTMLVAFGVCFELPLLVVMLNRIGVLPYAKLRRWQRGILFGLFVLAAIATPGSDPISMLVLSVTLIGLFELSVLIAWVHDRNLARQRQAAGLEGLDPDEASQLDLEPTPVDEPEPAEGERRSYDDAT